MDEVQRTISNAREALDDASPSPQAGAAQRALAEAEERRIMAKRHQEVRPREIDGRQGPEPVRYGDWENKGIAYDF